MLYDIWPDIFQGPRARQVEKKSGLGNRLKTPMSDHKYTEEIKGKPATVCM